MQSDTPGLHSLGVVESRPGPGLCFSKAPSIIRGADLAMRGRDPGHCTASPAGLGSGK